MSVNKSTSQGVAITGILISIATMSLLVIALVITLFIVAKDRMEGFNPKYHPSLNPHPKLWVTVRGHIDKGLDVTLIPTYSTNNPKCRITVNFIEGADTNRSWTYTIPIHPNEKGDYSIKFYLDKLKSGYCDWQPDSIAYKTIALGSKFEPATNYAVIINKSIKPIRKPFIKLSCRLFGTNITCDILNTNLNYLAIPSSAKNVSLNFINNIKE